MTSRKFIAAIMGLSMTITGLSAPRARALEGDDLAKILVGATALMIIGAAVTNDRPKSKATYVRHTPVRRDVDRPHKSKKMRRAKLPQHCVRKFRTARGRVIQTYGQTCLERAHYRTQRLPQACYIQKRGQRKAMSGYKIGCLQRYGYRVSWW